jgi:hypothetical protein
MPVLILTADLQKANNTFLMRVVGDRINVGLIQFPAQSRRVPSQEVHRITSLRLDSQDPNRKKKKQFLNYFFFADNILRLN